MTDAQRKSSRTSRLEEMTTALKNANDIAEAHCKCTLNRMPEYYLGTKVAEHFAKAFKNFGFRLESSVQETLRAAQVSDEEINEMLRNPSLRGNGRFDLLIRTGKKGRPAHIIEFKRGARSKSLADDISRLAYVCDRVKSKDKLEMNYLVVTTKKTEDKLLEALSKDIDALVVKEPWLNSIKYELASYNVLGKFTDKHFQKTDQDFAVAIFEIYYK